MKLDTAQFCFSGLISPLTLVFVDIFQDFKFKILFTILIFYITSIFLKLLFFVDVLFQLVKFNFKKLSLTQSEIDSLLYPSFLDACPYLHFSLGHQTHNYYMEFCGN